MMLGRFLPTSSHTPQTAKNQGRGYPTVSSPETVAVIAHTRRICGPDFIAVIYGGAPWVHASNVARRAAGAFVSKVFGPRKRSKVTSGHAPITSQQVRPEDQPQSPLVALIASRAQMVCNRQRSLASIYEARQMIFAQGLK